MSGKSYSGKSPPFRRMAREVTHEEDQPYIVDEEEFEAQGNTIAVCECGLTGNGPFCDGSHQATKDEEDGTVYKYEGDDPENARHEVESDA